MRFYILILILLSIYVYLSYITPRNSRSLYYYRFDKNVSVTKPSSELIEPFETLFKTNRIKKSKSYRNANVIFFHLLTDYIFMFPKIISLKQPVCVYGLRSVDILANKALLYTTLFSADKRLSKRFTPVTYVLENPNQYERLLNDFDESKLYILKKNIQRQRGCTITNNYDYLKDSLEKEYVVAQELLQNPLLVSGHKINLRQYLVIIVKKNVKCLLYDDGFIYYTPKPFRKNSIDKDRHITTGYIDRRIYEENPLTVKQLYEHLGHIKTKTLKRNLVELFGFVAASYKHLLLKHDANHHTNFIILGCDVAVDNRLDCKIMEINKGPDLSYKDVRDKRIKYNLVKNTLGAVGLIPSSSNNFISVS